MKRNNKIALIFFSILYFALSIILLKNVSPVNSHQEADSSYLQKQAVSFYKTNRFFPKEETSFYQAGGKKLLTSHTSGYPFFMAIIYKIFGVTYKPIILLQIILTFLSAFLIFFATTYLLGETVATITFALFTINIGYLTFAQLILTDCLFIFLLSLFFERFSSFIKTKKTISLLTSGLILGISTIVKPASLYFPMFLIIFLLFFLFIKQQTIISNIATIILFLLCFSVPIKSMKIYNQKTYNKSEFTNTGNFNLYLWFWGNVIANQKNPTNMQKRKAIFAQETKKIIQMLKPNDFGDEDWTEVKRKFWNSVMDNPIPFITTWLKEMLKTYAGLYTTTLRILVEPSYYRGDVSFFEIKNSFFSKIHKYISRETKSNKLIAIGYIETIWSLLRYIFCFIGLLFLFLRKKWAIFFFYSFFIFYFSFITGFGGCSRYRTAFEFVLIILAAIGIYVFFNFVKHKNLEINCEN
jgi:4-amino-4-deoxy-L-arabinose transferase-like glycosyltransferase